MPSLDEEFDAEPVASDLDAEFDAEPQVPAPPKPRGEPWSAGRVAKEAFLATNPATMGMQLARAHQALLTGDSGSPEGYAVSAAQGLAGGFADELAAGEMALKSNPLGYLAGHLAMPFAGVAAPGLTASLTDPGTYRTDKRAALEAIEPQVQANPAGMLAGSMVAPTPGTGSLSGIPKVLARGAMGAAEGAVRGAGQSQADLTQGEAGKLASDAAEVGLTSGLANLGTAGAGEMLSKLRGGLARGADAARAAIFGDELEQELKRRAQALGGLGGEVQKGNRIAENLRRLDAPLKIPEAANLNRLEERLIASGRKALPGQLQAIDKAEAALAAATARPAQDVAEEAVAQRIAGAPSPIGAALGGVGASLKNRLADKALWAAGYVPGVGAMAKGIRGALRTPEGSIKVLDFMDRFLAAPEAFGKFAGPLLKAASESPESFAVTDFVLQQQEPEFRRLRENAESDEQNP